MITFQLCYFLCFFSGIICMQFEYCKSTIEPSNVFDIPASGVVLSCHMLIAFVLFIIGVDVRALSVSF